MKHLITVSLFALTMGVAMAQCAAGGCATAVKTTAKKEACCKATPGNKIAKAGKGCCNEGGQPAKFKVFASNKYYFFGCAGSAEKGRTELMAKHLDVGQVQAVSNKKQKIS